MHDDGWKGTLFLQPRIELSLDVPEKPLGPVMILVLNLEPFPRGINNLNKLKRRLGFMHICLNEENKQTTQRLKTPQNTVVPK